MGAQLVNRTLGTVPSGSPVALASSCMSLPCGLSQARHKRDVSLFSRMELRMECITKRPMTVRSKRRRVRTNKTATCNQHYEYTLPKINVCIASSIKLSSPIPQLIIIITETTKTDKVFQSQPIQLVHYALAVIKPLQLLLRE